MATETATAVAGAAQASLKMWNKDTGSKWQWGSNWTNVNGQFETYVNKYLFPKLQETKQIFVALGNRFDWLAKETPVIGQLSEEYVILDSIPVDLNLDKTQKQMFQRNYPRMSTKLYTQGQHKKFKITLNDNDNRLNWSTLGDAIAYIVNVYAKYISDINYSEEQELRAMLVDYAVNKISATSVIEATGLDNIVETTYTAMLNLQDNSALYNEANTASGGAVGRYTTNTKLDNLMILTDNLTKVRLLNNKIANTFQVAGLDPTKHIVSFNTLGQVYKSTHDITITDDATITAFKQMGDYQIEKGDVLPEESVFTFDVSKLTEFVSAVSEIKPDTDVFIFLLDVNNIYYKRNTSKLTPYHRYNDEMDEHDYTSHYYTFKAVSPFYNKVLIKGKWS